MLRLLRFDFYKLFKSRIMTVVLAISLLLTFVNPIWLNTDGNSSSSVVRNTFYDNAIIFSLIIFVSVYFALEYYSGYIKNIYNCNKIYYLLSKAVCLLTYICAFYILKIVVHTVFGYAYSDGGEFFLDIYVPGNTISFINLERFITATLLRIYNLFAIGMVALAFATVCRNAIAISIVPLAYYILSGQLTYLFDGLFGLDSGTIYKYTIMGCADSMELLDYAGGQSPNAWIIILVASTIGIVGAFLIGWLALRKRDVR